MQVETRELLRISSASEWYKDPTFLEWINSPETATWHVSGNKATEYSDVFFHMSGSPGGCIEGSDEPGYGKPAPPQEIWDEIGKIATEQFGEDFECLVWISNEVEG